MRDADKHIKKILDAYEEDFETNTWLLPGGKSRAILHPCVERMAAKAGIQFMAPEIISADPNNVVILVHGKLEPPENGGPILTTWSFGEAAPKNNKNAYVYSMAEKRGKGRVALKLLGLHGLLHDETETFVDDARPNGAEPVKSSIPVKAAEPNPPLDGIERSANPNQARKNEDWDKVVADLRPQSGESGKLLLWAKSRSGRLSGHPWRKEVLERWRAYLADTLANECHSVRELIRWREESHEHTSVLPTDWQLAASAVWEAAKDKTGQRQREDA